MFSFAGAQGGTFESRENLVGSPFGFVRSSASGFAVVRGPRGMALEFLWQVAEPLTRDRPLQHH